MEMIPGKQQFVSLPIYKLDPLWRRLPESERRQGKEEFREVVEHVCLTLFHESLLSISIGVAHFMIDGNDAEQLLAEADRRMYKEKRTHHPVRVSLGSVRNDWVATIQ